jgi:hypothetical protein
MNGAQRELDANTNKDIRITGLLRRINKKQ